MKIDQPIVKTDTEIFCNKCGMSCKGTTGSFNGLIEAEVMGGYDSTHLDDGDVYKFSLCERCLKELIDSFKLFSKQGNIHSPDNYNPDFDRRKYFGEGVKLWEDLPEEERKMWISSLGNHDWLKEVPREELIVALYEIEQREELSERDLEYIAEIKGILKERKP